MARRFMTPIDMQNLEVLSLRIENRTSNPGTMVEGGLWYRSDNHRPAWRSDATVNEIYPFASTNTANTGVLRDGSGNFSAGTITASLTGTASQATALNDGGGNYRSGSYYLNFGNTTGTRDHNAISDFDTQVRTSRLDQMAVPTASVSLNNQLITNLLDPSSAQDAATRNYVDVSKQSLDWKDSVRIATTVALPAFTYSATGGGTLTANANGAFPLTDDITLTAGQSILVKNETATNKKYNGIYTLSQVGDGSNPWILVRRSDANSSAKVTSGMAMVITEGTVSGGKALILSTADPITLNSTDLTFSLLGAGGSVTSVGLSLPSIFTVTVSPITSSGTLTAVLATQVANTVFAGPTTGADAAPTFRTLVDADIPSTLSANARLAISKGGTLVGTRRKLNFIEGAGISVTVTDDLLNEKVDVTIAAQNNIHAVTFGDGINTSYTITHGLGTKDIVIRIYDLATGLEVEPDIIHASSTDATVVFAEAPGADAYRFVAIGGNTGVGPASAALLAANNLSDVDDPNLSRVNVNQGHATVVDGSPLVIDFSQSNALEWELGASNSVPAAIGMKAGGTYLLLIKQGGTGSNTLTWDPSWVWAGGTPPTLQTAMGAVDIVTGYYDGTVLRAAAGAGWAS